MSIVMFDSGKQLGVNAIFLQPTYACSGNCPGCYVKLHKNASPVARDQMSIGAQVDLIKTIVHGHGITANQLTMSCDKLGYSPGAAEQMVTLFNELGKLVLWKRDNNKDIEIHITINSLRDLAQYAGKRLYPFDCISFSKMGSNLWNDIEDIKKYQGVKRINWNLQTPPCGSSYKNWLAEVENVHEFVDSIYLLHTKRPIGENGDIEQLLKDRQAIDYDLKWIRMVQERLAGSPKLMLDGCLQDAYDYKRTGHGCSASVSRFQIWPDGSVSGCAYARESATPPASTTQEVLSNIRAAKKRYDFRMCYIPGAIRYA